MFVCFVKKCNENFNCIDNYRVHLRIIHNSQHDMHSFICTVNECSVNFNNYKNLLSHLDKVHKVPKKSLGINCDRNHENLSEAIFSTQLVQESDDINEIINIRPLACEIQVEKICDSFFFKFLTALHSKNDLTKSTINEIYHYVKLEIIDNICDLVEGNEDIKEHIDISFKKFDSQYKFEKKA